MKEGRTSLIHMEDDDYHTLKRVIRWLYTSDYDDEESPESQSSAECDASKGTDADSTAENDVPEEPTPVYSRDELVLQNLTNHVLVYAMADKYHIPALALHARTKFRALTTIDFFWPLAGLPTVVQLIYTTTPPTNRGLRDLAMAICGDRASEIYGDAPWMAIMEADGVLAVDFMGALVEQRRREAAVEFDELEDALAETREDLRAVEDANERVLAKIGEMRVIAREELMGMPKGGFFSPWEWMSGADYWMREFTVIQYFGRGLAALEGMFGCRRSVSPGRRWF